MKTLAIQTRERTEFVDITAQVQAALEELGVKAGAVTVFVPHTTAGITINENADPDVVADIKAVLDGMVPWTGHYRHGEGNAAAHVKAGLMGSSVRVLVENSRLQLGTWQAIYFCEFDGPRCRLVWVSGT
ncbi:MAG: secondary thiamine-phosphate synthase enzyme YjbQ [Kiritimatiellae bacterium]|nr:secondary thiamine-phosphate synthase enzyme YjbQ [Verrucomicrobiota bacterium]MBU4291992.1 secondary thiamine-phosphate synthase enzyme YjbQ [Verrucomicrobiota bacterium]MCG2678826.1 secondary thiamine-phosphate synthase enzyme YjbQ [Kiritimatiellia bacterium]